MPREYIQNSPYFDIKKLENLNRYSWRRISVVRFEGLPAAGAVESIQGERSGVLAASPETNYLMQRVKHC